VWGYRLLLDRDAGPLDDIDGKLAVVRSTRDLRTAFLASPEYSHKNPGGADFIPESGRAIAVLPEDLRLFVDLADRMIGVNILRGGYELEEVAFARSRIAAGDHVLDIGANIGYFTVLMASWVGESGTVAAFEPVPANLQLLRRSVAENGFDERVQIHEAVVAEEPGDAQLLNADVRHAFNSGGSHIVAATESIPRDHRRLKVAKLQIDALDLPRPVTFIKIDAEGAEAIALRGAQALLRADRPWVLAEMNPELLQRVSATTAADWISSMAELGYDCRVLESGRPGELIRTVDTLVNVVFVPRRG
jgi:FkbM family methyltransferase